MTTFKHVEITSPDNAHSLGNRSSAMLIGIHQNNAKTLANKD